MSLWPRFLVNPVYIILICSVCMPNFVYGLHATQTPLIYGVRKKHKAALKCAVAYNRSASVCTIIHHRATCNVL